MAGNKPFLRRGEGWAATGGRVGFTGLRRVCHGGVTR
jgi:hypothetical protein